jgi:intein/homing endonuclease
LSYDTKVKTEKGFIYIGDLVKKLESGEKIEVLSYNEKSKRKEYKSVKQGLRQGIREVMELEFENGKMIRCTPNHLFFIKGKGWTQAKDLMEEDDILE